MNESQSKQVTPTDYLYVSKGIPKELTLLLQKAIGAKAFVETGTYRGETTRWAGEHFTQVFTIEASEKLHRKAIEEGNTQKHCVYKLGDSSKIMPGVIEELSGPTIFWLDGHYSGGVTAGSENECPVLDELKAIAASDHEHVVLIDDSRMFLSTPPKGHHRKEDWPTIAEILGSLQKLKGDLHVVVILDMVVAVPDSCKGILEEWCADLNSRAWDKWLENKQNENRGGFFAKIFGK